MKTLKFRIKNYKSIVDSGDCYFSEKLTILAGKNESGKTSVLEALEDFHEDKMIRDGAKPIHGDFVPEVSVSFELSKTEANKILQEIGAGTISGDVLITLTKQAGSKAYSLDLDSRNLLKLSGFRQVAKKTLTDSILAIEFFLKKISSPLRFPQLSQQKLSDYKAEVAAFKSQNPTLTDIAPVLDSIGKVIDDYYSKEKWAAAFAESFVKTYLPYFILFSSFEDEFPKSIPISSLAESSWAADLEKVSNFSVEKMSSASQQEQVNHEEMVNVEFTKKFKKYWTQDTIRLQVKKDGLNLNFWIKENNRLYFPAQRSKGQQWYLAFFVKIVARLREGKPNVILIDEPGLYLHAKAQKDLLRVLLENTNSNPVVFSTHSPYLITEENLENVRLIEKAAEGTTILGKIHAHPMADKETLTPVLTAIGIGINDSITNLNQKNNVVVEGAEDTFYLRAFKELVKKGQGMNFISGGGASNMGFVGTILEGWGAHVCYLYDNDQGMKDGEKKLRDWRVLPEAIKTVAKKDGATIVDVLSSKDFKKYVLDDQALAYTSSNSEYVKGLKPGPDKVLLARQFLQRTRSGSVILDDTSKKNVEALFVEIEF